MGPVLEPRLHFRNLEIRTEASGQKPCTGNFWDVFIAYMRREVNVPLLSMLSSPPRPLPPFYPKYTSVYLCIRVNIMNFIEQQQMSVFFVYVSLYSMNVFVCLFVCFCLSISPVGQYLIFFSMTGALTSSCLSKCSLYSGKYFQKLLFFILFLKRKCHWNANKSCFISRHYFLRATKQNKKKINQTVNKIWWLNSAKAKENPNSFEVRWFIIK